MEGMLVLNGQLDNEIKGKTTTDNMQSVAMQGWWQHGFLHGYDLVRIKVGIKKKYTTLKKNKDAPIVADLFNAFANGGLTQSDIKRMANERGLRNYKGKLLDDNGIHRMFTQPAYAGYISVSTQTMKYTRVSTLKRLLLISIHFKEYSNDFVIRR